MTEDHRLKYNHRHPHSDLGYETPAAYAPSIGGLPPSATPAPTGEGQGKETGTNSQSHWHITRGQVSRVSPGQPAARHGCLRLDVIFRNYSSALSRRWTPTQIHKPFEDVEDVNMGCSNDAMSLVLPGGSGFMVSVGLQEECVVMLSAKRHRRPRLPHVRQSGRIYAESVCRGWGAIEPVE